MKGSLKIELNETDKNLVLFKTKIDNGIDLYINEKKINILQYKNEYNICYNFKNDGIYNFEIVFNVTMNDLTSFFENNNNLIYVDLSNFDSSNLINISFMFNGCSKLRNIFGMEKFITSKVKYGINASIMLFIRVFRFI